MRNSLLVICCIAVAMPVRTLAADATGEDKTLVCWFPDGNKEGVTYGDVPHTRIVTLHTNGQHILPGPHDVMRVEFDQVDPGKMLRNQRLVFSVAQTTPDAGLDAIFASQAPRAERVTLAIMARPNEVVKLRAFITFGDDKNELLGVCQYWVGKDARTAFEDKKSGGKKRKLKK